jgi:hypothetical protein
MAESVGLDLGAATSAAARLRGGEVEPALVIPITDLGVGATTTRHLLESLAARVVGPDPLPAVGVAVPSLDAGARAEIEAAAVEAFTDPLLVLRPAAAAAWFCHTNEVHPHAMLVVVEAEETGVVVTIVRSRPGGMAVEGGPSGRLLPSGSPVVDAVDAVAAALSATGLIATDIDVAVLVGGASWLTGLAEGICAATHLAAAVGPEPRAEVAYGAALITSEQDGFGVGTAMAFGAGVDDAAGDTAGTGLGAALRDMGHGKDAPADPVGAGVKGSVGGAKAPPSSPPEETGGAAKRPPSRLPAEALKRAWPWRQRWRRS